MTHARCETPAWVGSTQAGVAVAVTKAESGPVCEMAFTYRRLPGSVPGCQHSPVLTHRTSQPYGVSAITACFINKETEAKKTKSCLVHMWQSQSTDPGSLIMLVSQQCPRGQNHTMLQPGGNTGMSQ